MNDVTEWKPAPVAPMPEPAPKTKAERQLGWRHKNIDCPDDPDRKGVGMTVHLLSDEIAALDWIARHLYFAEPFGPQDEPTAYVPSRAQAIRELIARYMIKNGDRIPLDELVGRQREWGKFWIREASWRRASVKKKVAGLVSPPRMPALNP